MAALAIPVEQRVILTGVSWETYERLLADHPDAAGPRFTYDWGELEIMVLSARHEEPNRILARLVDVLAEEFGIDTRPLGSVTLKRRDLLKGFEPDSCFYFANAPAVLGREVDPAVDPPPDLVIEVDVSRPSLPRFPIFAAFGVPEVWRYNGSRAIIYRLEGGRYAEAERSSALPPLSGEVATRFLEESRQIRSTEWFRRVRDWARRQR